GGHFVTGHIESMGTIIRRERTGQDCALEIASPPEDMSSVVCKNSDAFYGISLIFSAVAGKSCSDWFIPHTADVTDQAERTSAGFFATQRCFVARDEWPLLALTARDLLACVLSFFTGE